MKKVPRKILVVDDDPGMLRLLNKWLKVAGYEVVEASDGDLAVKAAKKEMPDLILLDILMPMVDGREVARRLKADPQTKEIPIIFSTVCIKLEDDKGDQEIKVDEHSFQGFAKPLHNPKLLSTIRKAINRQQQKKNQKGI